MTVKRMTHGRFDRFRDESGISLIHVGLLLFVFMGLSMFVVDAGVLWLARVQAQNAADAGALAGATARGYEELADPPAANGAAYQSAMAAATTHGVMGEFANAEVFFTCPAFVPAGIKCTRVDVFRDGVNAASNPLPTYFAGAFGNYTQSIKATATAWTTSGNSTNCMRPWAVADRWDDVVAPNGELNHWVKVGNSVNELTPHDSYIPPPPAGSPPGTYFTGYRVSPPADPPGDQGTQIILKNGSPGDTITPGWFMAVDLPGAGGGYPSGASVYRDNIGSCVGVSVSIGDKLPTETGNMVGPTRQGVLDLVALDPGATFDTNSKQVSGGCMGAGTCDLSPRVVPVALFDADDYQRRNLANDWSGTPGCPGGGSCVTVVNILGFFVEGMSGNDVVGYMLTVPGDFLNGKGTVNTAASFSTVIQLIR
jgi:Flp pilus assembly protein TadG